jgi:hypothetical protein
MFQKPDATMLTPVGGKLGANPKPPRILKYSVGGQADRHGSIEDNEEKTKLYAN